ncbi:MAG: tryptophan synthase alpha chain [Chitinophagales bacterium]|nr:MAG: tryptophan synthase alpha chain [Chitinophagales bacterium]
MRPTASIVTNRIDELFRTRPERVLSVYYTAGFPQLEATLSIAAALEKAGADMLEIGMPYSDPLADGPVIQHSSEVAIKNGMTLHLLFQQLQQLRNHCRLPVLLMGYVNPVMQYGFERFCHQAARCGVDGIILPDMPLDDVQRHKPLFRKYGLHTVLLVTPHTPAARVRKIASLCSGFVYMVSAATTTGRQSGFSSAQTAYFNRIKKMGLNRPLLIGFGIHDAHTYRVACQYANGAIVGSYFIRLLEKYAPDKAARTLLKKLTRHDNSVEG